MGLVMRNQIKAEISYWIGNSQFDPGWYWKQNGFMNGPFIAKLDAEYDFNLVINDYRYRKFLIRKNTYRPIWERIILFFSFYIIFPAEFWYITFLIFRRIFP